MSCCLSGKKQDSQRALVLGGATGLLGQDLVKVLKCAKYTVSTLGRNDGNILDKVFLQNAIEAIKPHIIFNTIAYTQVDKAEDEKENAFLLNRDFPKLLGKIALEQNAKLVHYSTDFVFDGKKKAPYVETDEVNPLCVYGASKYAGEQALLDLKIEHVLIIRTAWLFGAGRKNFVSTILQKAKENTELSVVYDQIGSPTYSYGLAANSLALIESKANGLFHLTNSGLASWCELAQEAIDMANLDTKVTPISTEHYPFKAKRPPYSVLSTEKFTAQTGITPRSWTHALREYIYTCFEVTE